ncbi:hypothetical protein L1987_08908 [Smallanthus sonchifolius]|uniref:Uncharacterized protein n=1 Tax=Smallanthus sonchifolius TaxID=185202 RepID=A0ACB9JMH1_9ASTR|nr:hypothetical protein L1987_08908 [Smallanthus sonchifolius]
MKDPRRAMIMRFKVEDLKKAGIPLDDHLVIDMFVDDVCDNYESKMIHPSHYDEVRKSISWYARANPQDAWSMTCFVNQLERTRLYASDDIVRGMFNDGLHLSDTSKEVQERTPAQARRYKKGLSRSGTQAYLLVKPRSNSLKQDVVLERCPRQLKQEKVLRHSLQVSRQQFRISLSFKSWTFKTCKLVFA